ncbi:hypothetical protein AMAG_17001 [Allomyces macrogynus ATCC 38327]|uniref:DUF4246 domain-containing protein n=1 Tax=Allomyces macrogynus (strain ATCC 38327) TaxID=578462 RepID=A0A0L0TDD1_ALLM3|nr:hypothetical protein, variant [Allomyces macrogynus ATCC 38327]KNE72559.1 hypothetical protein AMAG_17001 [Allomyces macrogynus ATCC 38327]|eukprot:KNE72558.1 hypothetical protein, variant [Allomyces macrogynus ATCC 38327]
MADEDNQEFGRILRGPMPDANLSYVLQELDWQAEHLPMIASTDGVFALDDAVPDDVRAELVEQVFALLDNVPDHQKDWHPRSNNQMLDLVHLSLYPLVYGRTRAAITSYVNNLHPEQHAALYPTLARVFECALPLLEQVLGRLAKLTPLRIDPTPWNWYDRYDPSATDQKYTPLNDWYQKRIPNLPGPPLEYDIARNAFTPYSLRGRTLRVITKLANIHLTPTNPTYPGGSWHIEGMLNESIVATAIYYWDVVNITGSRLEFRTGVKPPKYEQSGDRGIAFGYALYRVDPSSAEGGKVVSTARELPLKLVEKVVAKVDSAMSVEELAFKGAVYNLCEH